jgi:hypothetical protein
MILSLYFLRVQPSVWEIFLFSKYIPHFSLLLILQYSDEISFLYLTDEIQNQSVSLVANTIEDITPAETVPPKPPKKMQLKRRLGLISAVNLIVGVMIGTLSSQTHS